MSSKAAVVQVVTRHLYVSPGLQPSAIFVHPLQGVAMPCIVLCLLLTCTRYFSPSLLCRLAIFYLVVPLISFLYVVAALCSVWSAYCPQSCYMSGPFSLLFQCVLHNVNYLISMILVLFLITELGISFCIFVFNIFLSIAFDQFSVWLLVFSSPGSLLVRHIGPSPGF